MTLDESKKLLENMYDALNAQDLEAHHKYWHDDMVWHGPPGFGDIHGIENFKYKVLKPFYEAFPDYNVKNDIVVAEGEWISATGFLTGTHKGNGSYGQPTNREVYLWGITQWEIKNNKIIKEWTGFNELAILMQILGDKK